MKGCLGCLGALVILALLLWPIEQLGHAFRWSDTETGYLMLAWLALLALGASGRRRVGSAFATPEMTALCGRVASRQCQAAVVKLRRSRAARPRPMDQPNHLPGQRIAPAHVSRDQAAGSPWERGSRPRRDAPATRARKPVSQSLKRARDPVPAQLRFAVLQRDGFRCRYCGRTCRTPGGGLHVDHVVPRAAGGAPREDNLRTACEECNLGKAARALVTGGS
jgi:5-methylcytosine-specific restriction endonuclease McrA